MGIKNLLDSLKDEILLEAKADLGEAGKLAAIDLHTYLQTRNEKLESWQDAYNNGVMSELELRSLYEGEKDLCKMRSLHNRGVNQIKIANFKNKIFGIVFNRLYGLII